MGLLDAFEGEPDFVNELGVKWWLDRTSTDYARREDPFGTRLPDAAVYAVEEPDGHRTQVLVIAGEAEYEAQSLEDMGVHIDMLKILARK